MDIGTWLRGLGLGQYEEAFRENDIDARVLPGLTGDDLKEIGVASVGHRRLLLQAITALAAAEAPAAPATGTADAAAAPAAPAREAERRQLTVMFVDLVGSTALSARLDPEEMREVIRAYQSTVATAVGRFEGHVAKFMGDGVLGYFGWPRAHEDEEERAVRAGLAVVAAVGRLATPAGEPLGARVGIATGDVVVGDLVGDGAAQEEAVVGETPNLAARLQGVAAPGGVVIGGRTRRLVQGLFELADLGRHPLRGFGEPVRAWRVLGPRRTEGRFEARHAKGVTPLVGREHELGMLLERWRQAKEGEGQVVLLAGEAGIGKSRLIRALRERLAGETYTALSHFCSPFHQTSALHPVIDLLERAAGLARDDPPDRALDKLEALLARGTREPARAAPLIAALLSLPTGGRYAPLELTPQRQKEETLAALLAQLAGLAAAQPVLVLYEDVHWADPTTLELIERVIERVRTLPVLVVVSFRPEFTPPWRSRGQVSLLALSRLGRARCGAIIGELTHGKALPAEVLQGILDRTDGVPLFVEELTKTVLESGLLEDAGERWTLKGPLPPLAIPATLRDSLMARLDRLAPVKEVAQVAACIGREFDHELLAAVVPLGGNELREALHRLAEAELVFAHGTPPHASYVFKHVLVRDAAYDSLLRSRRQQLHGRIAAALEERFPELVETQPELLARHCAEAGLTEKAVGYWLKAGQQAVARSAMAEAIAQLGSGLELLADLPDGRTRGRLELELRVTLAVALVAAKGYSAPEVGLLWARARALCREVPPDSAQLVRVLDGQFLFHIVRAEIAAALDIAEELLRLAERDADLFARVIGHRAAGLAHTASGAFARGREHLQQALELYDPARHRGLGLHHAFDARVGSLSLLSLTLLAQGHPAQATQRASAAVHEARLLGHPFSLALALFFDGIVRQRLGGREDVLACANELLALAAGRDFPLWLARAEILRGWALARAGTTEEGLALARHGLRDYEATGAGQWLPYFLALLSEVEGPGAAALQSLDDALTRADRTGERCFEAELHRRKGEALLTLAPGRSAEAEACFHRALAVAREQGARMWELRAATGLARLWRDQGRPAEARDLLAPIHGWFTEGFDTPDLREARALLDGLG